MRHILPLTVLFCSSFTAIAANPLEYYTEPSDVEHAPDMEGVTKILTSEESESVGIDYRQKQTYSFDGLLRPVSIESFNTQNSEWIKFDSINYEWDDQGRCVKRAYTNSETTWTFDEWGRLTKRVTRSYYDNRTSQEKVLSSISEYEYAYTANGLQSSSSKLITRRESRDSEVWIVNGSRSETTYTTAPLGAPAVERALSYAYDAETKEWVPDRRAEHSYQADGANLIHTDIISYYDSKTQSFKAPSIKYVITSRQYADGLFDLIVKQTSYSLLEDGTELLDREETREFAENVDGYPYRVVYTITEYLREGGEQKIARKNRETSYYDEVEIDGERSSRMLSGKRERWTPESDIWQTWYETSNVYDSEGRNLKSETLNYSDGKLSYGSRRTESEYDGLGRLVKQSLYDIDPLTQNDAPELVLYHRYELAYYGDTNALIREDVYSRSSTGELEHDDILTYTYDYSIPSEQVGSLSSKIPHKLAGSFLCLSMTETSPRFNEVRNVTKYTYTDRSELAGVENVAAEAVADGPAEYYNLQGVRVGGENLAPGVYIRRQGGSATKIRVR